MLSRLIENIIFGTDDAIPDLGQEGFVAGRNG